MLHEWMTHLLELITITLKKSCFKDKSSKNRGAYVCVSMCARVCAHGQVHAHAMHHYGVCISKCVGVQRPEADIRFINHSSLYLLKQGLSFEPRARQPVWQLDWRFLSAPAQCDHIQKGCHSQSVSTYVESGVQTPVLTTVWQAFYLLNPFASPLKWILCKRICTVVNFRSSGAS